MYYILQKKNDTQATYSLASQVKLKTNNSARMTARKRYSYKSSLAIDAENTVNIL